VIVVANETDGGGVAGAAVTRNVLPLTKKASE